MKLPTLERFMFTKEERPVYVLRIPKPSLRRGYSKRSCASVWTLAKAMAEELVEAQARKNRRCCCGRRDLFCRYYTESDWPQRMRECGVRKRRRVERIGSWVRRKLLQQLRKK